MESLRRYIIRQLIEKYPQLNTFINLYKEICLIRFYTIYWILQDILENAERKIK